MEQRMHQRSTRLVSPLGTYKLATQSQFVDKGDHYELLTNIPQSKENHIDIRTENGMLSISAKIVHEEEKKGNGMISTSRSVQMYQQSTNIPADADESGIQSSFKDGKLVIVIPKKSVKTVGGTKPVSKTAPSAAPETVKIPSAEKQKEENLPKIDENLKKKQPSVPSPKEEKAEKKTISLSDHTSIS